MTTTGTFYQASGSSPPGVSATTDATSTSPDLPPLPPELVEDLARLLAESLVADIRQYPNLAELQAKREATVESPSGLVRKTRSTRPRPAAKSGVPR